MDRRWLIAVTVGGLVGCGGDGDGRSDHGYVVRGAVAAGDTLYLSGTFREPRNAAGERNLGHELMVILDANDPAAPAFVAETDMKLTRPFGVLDGKLLAVQHGYDEEMLDMDVGPPQQNMLIKVFDLADPHAPTLDKTIEVPGAGGTASAHLLDDQHVVVTMGDGTEDGSTDVTWIVRPGAPAGSEVVGAATIACRVPALDGATLWCVNALGPGSGEVVGYTLGDDGSLTEIGRAPVDDGGSFPEVLLPEAATIASPGGSMVVADYYNGTFSLGRDLDGVPSVIDAFAEGGGAGTAALASDLTITLGGGVLRVVNPVTLADASTLTILGELDDGFTSGGSVSRLGGDGGLDGLFAAALGDYGVVLVQADGDTLEQVGGYYRHFGTTLALQDDLTEGNY